MRFIKHWTILALTASSVTALPSFFQNRHSESTDFDYLLFDAPAYPDPANPANTLAPMEAFVSHRRGNGRVIAAAITMFLKKVKHIDVSQDQAQNLKDRIGLVTALGLSREKVTVNVAGCNSPAPVSLQETSGFSNLGLARQTVSLGPCQLQKDTRYLPATVKLSNGDNREIKANIYPSPNSGFGVISDIDDTIKVSNVLNTNALIKSTLLDQPKAVPGMPQLYNTLSKTLNDTQFVYVSGSPFQLYPFLHGFIDKSFPAAAHGPIMLYNLTMFDPKDLINFINAGSQVAYEHKIKCISRLREIYPNKRWMMIGDSTQRDPEVYGEMYRKYQKDPNPILHCAWIRKVADAVNTDERFEKAFAGVPKDRWRVYTDDEIPMLENLIKQNRCREGPV